MSDDESREFDVVKGISGANQTLEQFAFDQDCQRHSREAYCFDQASTSSDEECTVVYHKPVLENDDKISHNTSVKRARSVSNCSDEGNIVKRRRSVAWRTEDVSVHDRKAAWVDAYGDTRTAKCCVCRFNEVGWENVGFDMAHVVPRACGGNNREVWNRVPTCSTCNRNVSSDTNLLDFIAEHYPSRIIFIVSYLWRRFSHQYAHWANKYFSAHGLEAFVRTMYGCDGIRLDTLSSFQRFLERTVASDSGRVTNNQVYRLLREYDEQCAAMRQCREKLKNLDTEISTMQSVVTRLQRIALEERERKRQIKKSLSLMCEN